MATLNTLRTRGGIVVIIVIGIALIAFLLGDLAGTERLFNARKMRVGSINGNNIGYMEYADASEEYTDLVKVMSRTENLSNEEQEGARNMAWEALVVRYSYKPGFENMGLIAGEAEQADMISGVYISPVIAMNFADRNTGAVDFNQLRMFYQQAENNYSGAMMKKYLEEQMVDQRVMAKYLNLITKGVYVTDLEVEHAQAASKGVYAIRYVEEPYSSIADSTVVVSESDIKSYYDAHKNMFRQTGARDIEYVVFDVVPSAADYQQAREYIGERAAEFAASDNPMQYAYQNSYSNPDERFFKESQLEPAMAAAIFNRPGVMYGPVLERNDTYVMARLVQMKNMPDSLGAKHILLPAGQQKLADSLVRVIRNGGDFPSLALRYSEDESKIQNLGNLGRFAPEQMIPQFSDAAMNARVGDVFTVGTMYGLHVVQLTYKSASAPKAQIARVTYNVEPGSETMQEAYNKANDFYAEANASYDNFKKAANESFLNKRTTRIRSTDPSIKGLEQPKELIRWAFNAEKNHVSPVMEIGGDYLVAALTEIREDGIAPLSQVTADIRPVILRDKKAGMIAERMKGSSIDQVASGIGAEVRHAQGVHFGSFYVDENIGVEPRLIGAVSMGAAPNALSKPVQGNTRVFMFTISDVNDASEVTPEEERVRLEANAQHYLGERASQAMFEASNVVDNRVKFF